MALTQEQREKIESHFSETLPHGSGIDGDWDFHWQANGKLCSVNAFHRMDSNGYYCGWSGFRLYFDPGTFQIVITGGHDQINNYLWDTFSHWLSENKRSIADILCVSLIPPEEMRLLEIYLGEWRTSLVKRFGIFGDWPQWAKDCSSAINTLSQDLQAKTDYSKRVS